MPNFSALLQQRRFLADFSSLLDVVPKCNGPIPTVLSVGLPGVKTSSETWHPDAKRRVLERSRSKKMTRFKKCGISAIASHHDTLINEAPTKTHNSLQRQQQHLHHRNERRRNVCHPVSSRSSQEWDKKGWECDIGYHSINRIPDNNAKIISIAPKCFFYRDQPQQEEYFSHHGSRSMGK